ncbi:MarR family winged helix-turn-helix transcriptional regulator [Marinobacter sp. JSM 1782161]|uniref:MarR family winged helix-turn-helix transcriptional regulator n=1 Tax=Marinobacter sp. JSM 1782161 TaxID=2685906 RepID=UPI001A9EF4E6|nr:MarR family transcriptional regulator [Marinobacter sp. JSM 1782161]
MKKASRPLSESSVFPGNLLRRCHQISVAIFQREGREAGLTQLQYIVLCALEEKGTLDQSTLGGLTALDRNTIAVVVRKLETKHWVARERNPEDRRSVLVTITENGLAVRQQAEAAALATQEALTAPLDDEERETLSRLLGKIANENNALSRVPLKTEAD